MQNNFKFLRQFMSCALLVAWIPIASAQESVAGSQGGSYVLNMNGDQVGSVTNDDGTVIQYRYDIWGNQSGMTVTINRVALTLDYATDENGGGWLYASPLPPLIVSPDAYGRTASATLYPGTWFENGEWMVDVNSPDPIPVASLVYSENGHLSTVTLNNGLSMQLEPLETQVQIPWGTPVTPAGSVSQSLYRSDGTLVANALPVGGTNAISVAPSQLDSVATQLGLGSNWAETHTFTRSANGQVTTARNTTTGAIALYLVDVGPFRVGYTPDGTAVFYDFTPNYAFGDDPAVDPSLTVAGVAPTQIVMTADGATGMYNDRPAEGAVYGAWIDAAGVAHYGSLTTEEPEPENARPVASQSSARPRKIGTNALIRHKSTVCVDDYCWVNYWYEWVEDGGGGSYGGPPSGGGTSPNKTGNQVKNAIMKAATDRALNKAKDKLKNPDCLALFNRTGTNGKKLIDVMRERQYTNAGEYLTKYLKYEAGSGSKDCPPNAKASTTVYGSRIAICSPFINPTHDGWNAVYLIHEMMHTLGQGEAPTPGQPTSSQLNQDVNAACGH